MPEVLFYHLKDKGLEEVLPLLLEKTLDKGWMAVVCFGSEERLLALNEFLWTYRDDSFLPHGKKGDDLEGMHPIILTTSENTIYESKTNNATNNADVLFLVDRAIFPKELPFKRVILIFDGSDNDALSDARKVWVEVKGMGLQASYWQEQGSKWVKKE